MQNGEKQHMTPNKKCTVNYLTSESLLQVNLANDSILYFYVIINVHLSVFNDTGKLSMILKDVLNVPKLQIKLYSFPSVT